ncbi:MAG: hypothetical protein K2G22_07615, partial [Eubacterium sp.]|nr:hypothetical protein [Eubacterium sp.]
MKKLKKLLIVLLALSVVFLSGCSNILSSLKPNTSDFYEITSLSSKADQYVSVDIFGDDILFLSFNETDAIELTVYNINKNKITAQKSLDDYPLQNISNAKFYNENEIIVYDNETQKGITYNLKLDKTNEIDYTELNYYDTEPVTDFIDDRYDHRENFSFYYDTNEKICVFNDEPDYFYIDSCNTDYILSDYGKQLLSYEYFESSNNIKIF